MLNHSLSQEDIQTIDRVAQKVNQLGLQIPTLFMLEAGRPLAFLGGQLLWVAQPAASLFVPTAVIKHWATLLEKPATFAALKQRLEQSTQ